MKVRFFLFALCLPFLLSSQDEMPKKSLMAALAELEGIPQVTIITNLDSLINERRRDTYQPAQMIFSLQGDETLTWDIKLKPRGKYRRRICDFPTVKLNFKKKPLEDSGLATYDDYKLVTHCLEDKNESYENVYREFLVYKLYNILTENSFKVQMLEITYRDSKKKKRKIKRFGFIIEDTKELEDRIGATNYEHGVLEDSVDINQLNFVALFQYMVGNTDWKAYPFAKNVKKVRFQAGSLYQFIPYDFDFSGVVNANYARPASHLNQETVRQRVFLGNATSDDDLLPHFKYFQSYKVALIKCIKEFKPLSNSSRDDIMNYIASFYKDIEDGIF
jgi:hypothetical protein